MRIMTRFIALPIPAIIVCCAFLTACGGNRMTSVPLYIPSGPVSERILNEARIAGNIAFGLYQNGQYQQALTGYQTALSNLFLIDHEQEIANIRHNIAHIYIALAQYDKAQKETDLALDANRRFGFAGRIALNLATSARISERKKNPDPDKALALYREAILILFNNSGSRNDLAVQYNNCGYLLLGQKKYPEAIAEFSQAIRYAVSENFYAEIAAGYSGIGLANLAIGKPGDALVAFTSALNADKATENSPAIAQDLKNMGKACEALNKQELALEYYDRALRINMALRRFDRVRTDVEDLIRIQTALGNTEAVANLKRVLKDL